LLLFCVAHSSCFDFGESDSVLRGARYGFHCLVLISHVSCLLFAGRRFGLPPSRLILALPVLAVRVFPLLSIAPRSGFHFLSSSVSTRSRAPVPFPGSMFPLEDFLFWFHAAGFLDPSCLWCPAQESFFCSVLVSSARAGRSQFHFGRRFSRVCPLTCQAPGIVFPLSALGDLRFPLSVLVLLPESGVPRFSR
jgi:hypothetical protein